jgi:DNA-binding XRE family transcriptional regulator
MADAAQVARRSYLEWEHGRTLPRLDSLLALSNFHKIPVETLLSGER